MRPTVDMLTQSAVVTCAPSTPASLGTRVGAWRDAGRCGDPRRRRTESRRPWKGRASSGNDDMVKWHRPEMGEFLGAPRGGPGARGCGGETRGAQAERHRREHGAIRPAQARGRRGRCSRRGLRQLARELAEGVRQDDTEAVHFPVGELSSLDCPADFGTGAHQISSQHALPIRRSAHALASSPAHPSGIGPSSFLSFASMFPGCFFQTSLSRGRFNFSRERTMLSSEGRLSRFGASVER